MHVLDSETGLTHTLAQHPILSAELDDVAMEGWKSRDMYICEDFVGFTVYVAEEGVMRAELRVWNWKTSELQLVCPPTRDPWVRSYDSRRTYMISTTKPSCLPGPVMSSFP